MTNDKLISMRKLLISLTIGLVGLTKSVPAQAPLYSNDDFKKILESYNEFIAETNGFDYKYTGNWITTTEI